VDVMNRTGRRSRERQGSLLLAVTLALSSACSLIVQRNTEQCKVDADCKSEIFGAYSTCSAGICVKPGGDTGEMDAGCFTGTPTTDPQFLNQCTDAGCEPFDNCARLGLCGDAGLPPLKNPDGGP
jgi:hypothetical protein